MRKLFRAEVLSEQFVEEAVELLLTRLIPLSTLDLERWTLDPEEWINQEEREGDAWEYDLRVCDIPFCYYSGIDKWSKPCGGRVLLSLCWHYHVYVVPILLKKFQQVLGEILC